MDPDLKARMIERKEKSKKIIKRKDFELFCKEYVFESLKGIGFGAAFCKRFDIDDSAISILKSQGFAKELIETLGYIEK
jgi:hypothetical protein